MQLHNSSALVVGGARGLGAATVRRLAAGGAYCVILDRDADTGAALAEKLGPNVVFVHGDVMRSEDVERALAAASPKPLRLTVNCSFVALPEPVLSIRGEAGSLDAFRQVIEVNLVGGYNVVRLAAEHMAAQKCDEDGQRGVIVSTSSTSGFDGGTPQVAYSVSKAAIAALSLPAARDLAPHGIRVMAIAPGPFATPPVLNLPEGYRTSLTDTILSPARLGEPDEFARLVVHIFANAFLNGDTIRLDGGSRLTAPPRTRPDRDVSSD